MDLLTLETNRTVSDITICGKVDYFEMQKDVCVFNRVIEISAFDFCLQEQGICLKKELEKLCSSVLFKSRHQDLYLIHSCDVKNVEYMNNIVYFDNYKIDKPFDTVKESPIDSFDIDRVTEDKITDYLTKKVVFQQIDLSISDLLTEDDKDTVISNMATYIDSLDVDEDICKKVGNGCLLSEDLIEKQKKELCRKCIINFFKQK